MTDLAIIYLHQLRALNKTSSAIQLDWKCTIFHGSNFCMCYQCFTVVRPNKDIYLELSRKRAFSCYIVCENLQMRLCPSPTYTRI